MDAHSASNPAGPAGRTAPRREPAPGLERDLLADALIAGAYLAGTNTRRVRRALAALFGGAVDGQWPCLNRHHAPSLAKGLEFRAVVLMARDDKVIPLQGRIESVGDDADLQEVYDTERHLLYVACTRARDHLLVTSVEPASEFLDDLRL